MHTPSRNDVNLRCMSLLVYVCGVNGLYTTTQERYHLQGCTTDSLQRKYIVRHLYICIYNLCLRFEMYDTVSIARKGTECSGVCVVMHTSDHF